MLDLSAHYAVKNVGDCWTWKILDAGGNPTAVNPLGTTFPTREGAIAHLAAFLSSCQLEQCEWTPSDMESMVNKSTEAGLGD